MTPRESDRYEEKARELVDLFVTTGTHVPEMRSSLAAALRQAADDALERAAQDYERAHSYHRGLHGSLAVAAHLRALASPAAAPAAEVKVNACQVDLRTDKDRECFDDIVQAATRVLRSEPAAQQAGEAGGAAAPCNPWSTRSPATATGVEQRHLPEPAPLLPRVLAALEDHGAEYDGKRRSLAAELRAYIAKAKGEGK